ncbi:MAG TPA: hypothetical protein VFX97_03665 [Pyrinomonadaceae bacterium]|nr:hypothetical protein [Pyrinomonadaceae bacterium]
MTISKLVIAYALLIVPVTANAQSATGQCWVDASTRDNQTRQGTGITHLGSFNPLVSDGTTFKTFRPYQNLVVTAGVEFEVHKDSKDARFQEVRLMIAASTSEAKPIFGLVDSSEASTAFKKRWYLTVSKRIDAGSLEYTFRLRCWDNVKFPK